MAQYTNIFVLYTGLDTNEHFLYSEPDISVFTLFLGLDINVVFLYLGPDIFRVRCHVEQCVIFYMGENWEGRIHERMSKFVVNGKSGWGISEWDYW